MTKSTKFLGVMIDQHLTFRDHVQYIKGKVARGIGILYKCKRYLNKCTLLTLYNAFINPYFGYCITVWGNTYKSVLDPLEKLQKRAIRLISGAMKFDHTKPLFQDLQILNLSKMYLYTVQLFLFKYHHKSLPDVFLEFYVCNNDTHEYHTRHAEYFRSTLAQSIQKSNSVRTSGVYINNYFRRHLSYNCSYMTYKNNLRRHILLNDIELSL